MICRRAPAPRVALDEREHERGEADRERGDAGDVDLARRRSRRATRAAANSVTTTAPTATGRLRKKIARQETSSVSQPPSSGPSASAMADTPAHVPIALPRSSGGNALVMIESVPGIISAAPTPWTAREATSQPSVGAKPIVAERERRRRTTPIRKTLAAAEDVAEPPAGDEQHGEGERVGVDRPLERRERGVEVRAGSTAARRSRRCCRASP